LQIAAKPLQITTRLLLTAYRKLPTLYPTALHRASTRLRRTHGIVKPQY